jgi:hypothetical protein
MTAPTPTSTLVRPFTVSISDSEIDDVKQRLARTRWPDPETVGDWSQGVRVENARSLVDYWERGYDWRRFESELNRFPQFLTEIDGLDIHFIHVRSKNPNAMPLILTHGLGTARDPGQRNPHRPAHPSFLTPTRELRSARVSLGLH